MKLSFLWFQFFWSSSGNRPPWVPWLRWRSLSKKSLLLSFLGTIVIPWLDNCLHFFHSIWFRFSLHILLNSFLFPGPPPPPPPSDNRLFCPKRGFAQRAAQRWKPVSSWRLFPFKQPMQVNHKRLHRFPTTTHCSIIVKEPLWFWRPAINMHLCGWDHLHSRVCTQCIYKRPLMGW